MGADAWVETTNLSKRFGDVWALRCLNLRVGRGSAFGLLGPKGAGGARDNLALWDAQYGVDRGALRRRARPYAARARSTALHCPESSPTGAARRAGQQPGGHGGPRFACQLFAVGCALAVLDVLAYRWVVRRFDRERIVTAFT